MTKRKTLLTSKFPTVDVEAMLIENLSFFNHVHIINQKFDILPDKPHFGMAINYIDLQESREFFVRELINSAIDWIYSQAKQKRIIHKLMEEGRSQGNAQTELTQRVFEKFRPSNDGSLLHGQFGELLLGNCIQKMFRAVPILRKMPLTTSNAHERFGADAIHFAMENNVETFYIGEAKCYTSKYKFNTAFECALSSILTEYNNIHKELHQYLHEDFLEPPLQQIATDLQNGRLESAQFRLVSIIAYEETSNRKGATKEDILKAIDSVIENKYKNFNNMKIDLATYPILNRITYIVFPVWKFEELIRSFSKAIPHY
jgi:hypothetical protein